MPSPFLFTGGFSDALEGLPKWHFKMTNKLNLEFQSKNLVAKSFLFGSLGLLFEFDAEFFILAATFSFSIGLALVSRSNERLYFGWHSSLQNLVFLCQWNMLYLLFSTK